MFHILNLRRTFWRENIYSCSYRWGTDVPVYTNILALWNPLNSGKTLKVLQVDFGASASNNITVIGSLILFSNVIGATDLSSDIVKYNPNAPNTVAKIYGGGVLTLGKVLDRRSLNFSNFPSESFDFKQEFELLPNSGLCVVHESESSGNTYLPWVTFVFYE